MPDATKRSAADARQSDRAEPRKRGAPKRRGTRAEMFAPEKGGDTHNGSQPRTTLNDLPSGSVKNILDAAPEVSEHEPQPLNGVPALATVPVLACIPDAPVPPGTVVPPGWELGPKFVHHMSARYGTVINAAVVIKGRVLDCTDGNEWIIVAWRRGEGWKEAVVERAIVSSTGKIVQLANKGLPVNTLTAPSMVQYLSDFEAANFTLLPMTRVTLAWPRGAGRVPVG